MKVCEEHEDVQRISDKLDKMLHTNKTDGALDLLRELKDVNMSLETLQSTRVGVCVNAVRKQSSDPDVQTEARTLIKCWKKLLDESEKKKQSSPVRSSDLSKDSSSEKRKMPEVPHPCREDPSPCRNIPEAPPPSPHGPSFPPAPVSSDSVRSRCQQLLMVALQTDDDYKSVGVDCHHLAAQIEQQIFQLFKSTDIKYKSRLRSRVSNLKDPKNPELRRNLLRGNISPQRLASMSAEEMASAELKQMREALTKESIREHQLSKFGGTDTDMFTCNKCHGKSCTYTQVQTRSADEPMTTFVLCTSCGNRWKFN